MKPKYEFTGKTKIFEGITLHQIKRLSDGYVGGWIESEANLSHEDTCWVWDNAMVFGHARVSGNAKLFDKAIVRDYAIVTENAKVCGCGVIRDRAVACGNASIGGIVCGSARVSGKASVGGVVCDTAIVCDEARLWEATVSGNSLIEGKTNLIRGTQVIDSHINAAFFFSNCQIQTDAVIDEAYIKSNSLNEGDPHRRGMQFVSNKVIGGIDT